MDTYHHITFGKEAKVDEKLADLGIKYKKTDIFHRYILTFNIYESDPNWPTVARLMNENNVQSLSTTVFTDDEVVNAEWLRLVTTFEQGYPQPEKAWLKNKPNYANYCRQCGTFQQVESFQLKKEPYLRKNAFFSLLWARTFFARNAVFDALEEYDMKGYERWDAIIRKTQQPSTTVAQLRASDTTQGGLTHTNGLSSTTCSECGITKYLPQKLGIMYYMRNALPANVDVIETHEWFGDGHMAFRELLVSHRFAELAIKEGWKGIRFKVVELV